MSENQSSHSLTTKSRSETVERYTESVTLHSYEIDYLISMIDSRLLVLKQSDLVELAKSIRNKLTARRKL